jgi:hypothetical protein
VRVAAAIVLSLLAGQDLDTRRDAIAARLEGLRGLKFKTPLVLREGTRKEYAAYLLQTAKRVYGEDLGSAEKGLKALGLIPPKMRLDVALTIQAGFGAKVFCSGNEIVLLDPKAGDDWILNKMDLGLVDQHFPAVAAEGFDAQLAAAALRMGDAEVAKHLLYGQGKITEETLKKLADETDAWEKGDSRLASAVAPRLFVRAGDFPWRRGAVFAVGLYVKGGQAGLDRAWARPPRSTEQVLHPEKYAGDEKPLTMDSAAARDFLKDAGYARRHRTTLGELGTALVLETQFPREELGPVSEGWGGDALEVYEREDAPPLVLWISAWDTEADAIEFQAQAFRLMKKLLPPDSELAAPVLRKQSIVAFAINVPKPLQEGLMAAAVRALREY